MNVAILITCLLATTATAQKPQYTLQRDYSGQNFFNGWDFYGNFDNLTNGDAIFVSAAQNAQAKLAYVTPQNTAIIKVDNTSTVPFNEKRNTVRITTQDRFAVGSVWVADMLHLPYGCSVWPAWWSQAPNWPAGGEIDTLEGVNLVTLNQMALHTEGGCMQDSPVQSSPLINSTNCAFDVNSNQGCVTTVPSPQSYGAGFSASGGGVYVTEMAQNGISIWFFPRSQVPSSLTQNASTIDTSTFGTPTGNWPSTGCDVGNYFQPQHLIFDITLCGDFAGNPATFAETCPGTCYKDYVIGNASNYDNAYFEVNYVRVYGNGDVIEGPDSSGGNSAQSIRIPSLFLAGLVGLCWMLSL